jgi:hypothetical protein
MLRKYTHIHSVHTAHTQHTYTHTHTHLVHDPRPGGHDQKVLERGGTPLQELEALGVTLHLALEVLGHGIAAAVVVDLWCGWVVCMSMCYTYIT